MELIIKSRFTDFQTFHRVPFTKFVMYDQAITMGSGGDALALARGLISKRVHD